MGGSRCGSTEFHWHDFQRHYHCDRQSFNLARNCESPEQARRVLEQAKQRHQLSLAALDRRLQVHQEAYALWRKFSTAAHDKNDMDCLATECEDWWLKNCLYLSTEAREAFFVAWQAASHHKEFVDIGDLALIDKNNKKIADAVIPILKGVALPSLDGSQLEADGKGKTVNS